YLMYTVLDTIIDLNFDIMDQLEETLVSLENEIFTNPNRELLEKIHEIKLEVIRMRRYISPIRDMTAGLLRSDSALIEQSTRIYLRDVHDHVLRIIESIETHREILASLLEIYLSSISGKLNEVMKVLTVFRSEEHTSELQSRENLVCRLLLEKKNLQKLMNSRGLPAREAAYQKLLIRVPWLLMVGGTTVPMLSLLGLLCERRKAERILPSTPP